MDGSPLTRKVVYGYQTVIQGQGHFPKRCLPHVIPPVLVWKGYEPFISKHALRQRFDERTVRATQKQS